MMAEIAGRIKPFITTCYITLSCHCRDLWGWVQRQWGAQTEPQHQTVH